MISRRAFLLGLTLPLIGTPRFAFSQDSACTATDNIVALADYVIANRSKLPKLQNRRNGAISAYLKTQYQTLDAEQTDTLLIPLGDARVDRAQELRLTQRIAALGLENALAEGAPDAETNLLTPGFGYSPLRAAIRSGEIPALFDRLAKAPDTARFELQKRIVGVVLDLDDESKKMLGVEAAQRKLMVAAAGFAATQDDDAAWPAFVASVNDKAETDKLAAALSWLRAYKGKPALPHTVESTKSTVMRALFHQTMIAAAHVPERDYLMTYVNLTGDMEGGGRAAAAIIDLTRDGAPIDMETAWLVINESLSEAAKSTSEIDARLKAIPFTGTRFGGETVREILDHMLAIEALKTIAAGGSGTPPASVAGASADFQPQYAAWKTIAATMGAGGDLTPFRASGQKLSITANLLFASGRYGELSRFLTSTVPNADSIRLAELFAEALDRKCAGHLAYAGESVLMPAMPMFRFEPQT